MERLILFAKRPLEGHVKTRLVPPLTHAQARELHEAFLWDALALLGSRSGAGRELELCMDGAWDPPEPFHEVCSEVRRGEQGPGDLGARMLRAFRRSAAEGVASTVIVGADVPALEPSRLEEALARLGASDGAVVCPSHDGGYVLIGMRDPCEDLFRDIPWGTGDVLEVTRSRARGAGLDLHELAPTYDVDVAADLVRLREDLNRPEFEHRARATRRVLETLNLQVRDPAGGN